MAVACSAVRVLVLRHGCAGDKSDWPGDDAARPLDHAGVAQAAAIVDLLADAGVRRILTSPTARCRQTVEPLAARLGLPVEDSSDLAVGGRVLLTELAGHGGAFGDALACTHGELMQPLLDEARAAGAEVVADRDEDGWLLGKGTGWELDLDAEGRVTRLRHLVPAAPITCTVHAWPEARQ